MSSSRAYSSSLNGIYLQGQPDSEVVRRLHVDGSQYFSLLLPEIIQLISKSVKWNQISSPNYHCCAQLVRINIIGAIGVGKASIVSRYTTAEWTDSTRPLRYPQVCFNTLVGDAVVRFAFSGIEAGTFVSSMAYTLVSLTPDLHQEQVSFLALKQWYDNAKNEGIFREHDDFVNFLCGNKIDLPNREVPRADAEEWAVSAGLRYVETSARTGVGIGEMFQLFAEKGLIAGPIVDREDEALRNLVEARPIPRPLLPSGICQIS